MRSNRNAEPIGNVRCHSIDDWEMRSNRNLAPWAMILS